MDAPMTPREAVAWLVENTAATRKTYCIILRSTNGVHNPGTRGMLICGLMWCGLHITRAMHLRRLGLPRCGRCRYWATVQCPLYGRNTPSDFCSRGEKRGD